MAVLAEVVRSGFVEGRHHGSLVALAPDGTRLLAAGDPDAPVFPRSVNKPFQVAAMLRLGLAEAFGLDDRHVAIAASSHDGDTTHLDAVGDLLGRAGLSPADLGCPADPPLGAAAARGLAARGEPPSRMHHNCSGKHAALLATCVANGWPAEGYLDPGHPLQRHVLATVEDLCGARVAASGVDGCGAPVLALPLGAVARGFTRLVRAGEGSPEGRVAAAMRAHPGLVGGVERDVTRLMGAVPGLLAKDGAEGNAAVALPDGTALAFKIDDGAGRARLPVTVAALRALGVTAAGLDGLGDVPLLGGGVPVGCVRAVPLA